MNDVKKMAQNVISSSSVHHNTKIIENLDANDFVYLERDLDFYEKVSLVFLLYGDNPVNAKIGCQRLLILYHSQHSHATDILSNWIRSRNDSNWRLTIIEALWTIKAKHVLKLFGLDIDDLRIRFLDYAEINLHIHPILKGLYHMCEEIVPSEAKLLVDHVNNKDGGRHPLNFTDEKYLEVFLLHWLAELVIQAGEWSVVKSKRNIFCNIEWIMDFLKENKPALEDKLRRIIIRFNFTPNNVTSVQRKKNVTDDDGDEDKKNVKASQVDQPKNVDGDTLNHNDDKYLIREASAGYVLIINQIEFYRDKIKTSKLPLKDLEKREGTDQDRIALKRTFSALSYKIVEKENLTDDEILIAIVEIVAKSGAYDSLIVCILSHGSRGTIYGCNSVPVKTDDILDIIVSKELINKPKILILQSCQGDQTQKAEPIESSFTDSKHLAHDGVSVKTLPMRSDFYVAKSTIPGFTSIRHKKEGSWFIQTLCKIIDNESRSKHFAEIMTTVKRKVSELRGDNLESMVSICEDAFRKSFFFPTPVVLD